MPYRTNGRNDVTWPRSLQDFAEQARQNPLTAWAAGVLVVTALASVVFTAGLMYAGHQERQKRQEWIETKFEQFVGANNELLTHAEQLLSQQTATNDQVNATLGEVRDALEANQRETREFRRAVLEWMKQEKIIP